MMLRGWRSLSAAFRGGRVLPGLRLLMPRLAEHPDPQAKSCRPRGRTGCRPATRQGRAMPSWTSTAAALQRRRRAACP
eukprot:3253361-Alexandrium_andersonii.AAC.1